jgi:hypothetical protein
VADVTFAGSVSAQQNVGETVSITVTKPDSTTEVLTALTLADKTYSVTKTYTIAGNYSAKAHVAADAIYAAADSSSVAFVINLTTRTVTLTINVV